MIELGELESHHAEFAQRHVRIVAISNDDQKTASETQADFPHLVLVADAGQPMAKAIGVTHIRAGRDGSDTNAPTTFLVDTDGKVRWMFRPQWFLTRLSAAELLAAVDATWPAE